jgi:hypothetical protein
MQSCWLSFQGKMWEPLSFRTILKSWKQSGTQTAYLLVSQRSLQTLSELRTYHGDTEALSRIGSSGDWFIGPFENCIDWNPLNLTILGLDSPIFRGFNREIFSRASVSGSPESPVLAF